VDLLWGMTVNGSNGRTAPRLSIVVPAAGEAAALEETLVSVLENRPADCEIIVVHGCDYADPWSIGDEVRLVRAPRRATVVGCTNLGIATATGRVIHVLAAGWRATDGWADGPVDLIDTGRADVVVPLAVCGTDLADADAAAAVAAARGAVVLEPTSRVIVGPPRRRSGPFLAGMHAERLFWRSLAATPLLPALALHAVEWLRHMAASAPLGTVPMLAGRLAALVQLGSCVPRAMQLRGLRRRAVTAGKRLDSDRERTIRIDAPHERPAEPRRSEPGEPTVPLRRSA